MTDPVKLISSLKIKGLTLKNRITMAPLYLGYASPDGTVSPLMLEHYAEMADSGAALIVVENSVVDPSGLGSPFTLRIDDDRFIPGLSRLAQTIHDNGALAFLQINHAGRYAFMQDKLTPSGIKIGELETKEMSGADIDRIVECFASGAKRVREAGFDGVEIHGGTGYLIVQFLSPRTNLRTDEYGGSLENRMRFPLRVADEVINSVGKNFPVGYRFLADEELPDGLHVEETAVLAEELEKRGVAYISVMAGTYDAFILPEYIQKEKQEAYMAHYAGEIKKAAAQTPIITAGRIKTPETAESIIEQGTADLIGLARVLLADPLWPKKAAGLIDEPIVECEPSCSLCLRRTMVGKPAFCSQWEKDRREAFLNKIGEKSEEA
ncbi:MAG: NADH:flavin oxidoreductase [Deltaproteobacteria bacterium]|nr:NADH:flavin oxidoreductase [Deltaproteobacteria bacterium]